MIVSSAPASLMLLGEHAVLHGEPALVAAVDQRITVQLSPRTDSVITIESQLGSLTTSLDHIVPCPPFQFVLHTIKHCRPMLRSGFDLHIHSHFSHQVGLGSSAAVTVALLAALYRAAHHVVSLDDLIKQGRDIIRQTQGSGSGADVAASVLGGVVHYAASPFCYEKLSVLLPLSLLYCGFKTKTAEVIAIVQNKFQNNLDTFHALCRVIGQCVAEGLSAIKQEDWHALGRVLDAQQKLMVSLGVSLPILDDMVLHLKNQNDILGAKISGSGLGDCVLGLGSCSSQSLLMTQYPDMRVLPVTMSLQGVSCEEV